jgi:hypothetical protein
VFSICPSDRILMIQDHVGIWDHLPFVTVPSRTNQQMQIKDSTQFINKFSVETTHSQQQHVTILNNKKNTCELPSMCPMANDITHGISNCPTDERLMSQNHGNLSLGSAIQCSTQKITNGQNPIH